MLINHARILLVSSDVDKGQEGANVVAREHWDEKFSEWKNVYKPLLPGACVRTSSVI